MDLRVQRVTKEQVLATYKPRDSWWTVFLVDPIAGPAVRWVSAWRFVTPNLLTVLAFVLGLGSAACFALGTWPWLVAGALLFHLSFTVDCMDGKLARVRGGGNLFGGWLDYICDRLRVLICTVTLFAGQYVQTENTIYFYFAVAVVFCDMFRYLNALYLKELRREMRAKLAAAQGLTVDQLQLQDEAQLEIGGDKPAAQSTDAGVTVVDVQGSFKQKFGWFSNFRDFLVRHRVRSHVFSGVEYQMAVFIIAPLTSLVLGVTIAAIVLLLLAEAAVTYKLYLSAADIERQLAA